MTAVVNVIHVVYKLIQILMLGMNVAQLREQAHSVGSPGSMGREQRVETLRLRTGTLILFLVPKWSPKRQIGSQIEM